MNDLLSAILDRISEEMRGFHVSMPGRVVSFDPDTQTAEVKPLLKRRYISEDGEEYESIPPLVNVPIIQNGVKSPMVNFCLRKVLP